MEGQEKELLFSRKKLTHYEKLLFAESHIIELKKEIQSLKIEIGKQKSYIQELENYTINGAPRTKKFNKAKKERIEALKEKTKAEKKAKKYLDELIRIKLIVGDQIRLNI